LNWWMASATPVLWSRASSPDWSTVRGITAKEPLWWRIVRKGSSLEVLYSLDGKNFIAARLG